MFFSFFNSFFSKSTPQSPSQNVCDDDSEQKEFFRFFAREENGYFYENFNLFYQDTHISIDLLFFIPYRGLLFGEKLQWDAETLQGATVKLPSQKNDAEPSTRLGRTEAAIRHKLEDILSFDSTVCERFIWLSRLSEDEFDTLDSSFHELLPKERLIFNDSTKESIHHKLCTLAPKLSEPYQKQRIMGSLQSHMLLVPTEEKSNGTFLSDEQKKFLETDYSDTVTSLFGEYHSGKSTVLIRKALLLLLNKPDVKILIITPTLIGGEILRNELVSLIEYGALKVELASLTFSTPAYTQNITEFAGFQSASVVMCDDAYTMEKDFLDALIAHREKRWLLLSFHNEYIPISDSTLILHNNYQKNIPFAKIPASADNALLTLLLELRVRMQSINAEEIMVILQDDERINDYKEAIDEYFRINARLLTPEFSLQYQNLDDLIITTPENAYGLHMPHIYLVTSDESEHYTYALSRASESATIISISNPKRGD
ncbi:hypothetical protein Sulku_0613 [Sulfuricurvum kujiense DSM 16994]|uniref:Uncharacterized protein n=1 Tax=Sulfuricurvum kujiense (strain ATCC BAA-921 / DSM 16994 / JCM 11577 / YK-1) TaxID=709032 RepID=E4U0Q3_SULKY|nr:hypothetical protein [Sulfuricurvum kujiense]ADR33279.1 hypothetical protein Sulku_0613 [Sulfuricurvum kujiense DSM 16994]